MTEPNWPSPTGISPAPANVKETKTWNDSDFSEETVGKIVVVVHGDKGVGKTSLAFGFPGRILCLSFDHKSQIVKETSYNSDPRIKVINAVKFYADGQPEDITKSANTTISFIEEVLRRAVEDFKPHFVVIDGAEILEQICEMKMRFIHNLGPSQGFAERNWWKDRRFILRGIHRAALDTASLGLIYTTYTDRRDIIVDGSVKTTEKSPRWIDVLVTESDIVIEALSEYNSVVKQYSHYAHINTSKFSKRPGEAGYSPLFDILHTGDTIDVSNGKPLTLGPGISLRLKGLLERQNADTNRPQLKMPPQPEPSSGTFTLPDPVLINPFISPALSKPLGETPNVRDLPNLNVTIVGSGSNEAGNPTMEVPESVDSADLKVEVKPVRKRKI